MYSKESQRRLVRIARYLGKNDLYGEAAAISKIAADLEAESKEDGQGLIDKVFSLFSSNKNKIISYLTGGKVTSASRRNHHNFQKEALFEKIPFAAEALSIYFYIIDSSQFLPLRAIVAIYLLGISGILAGETATLMISQILQLFPVVGTAIATLAGFITADIEAITIAAAIPPIIAIYELLVDDKHVEQAKKFLEEKTISDLVDPTGINREVFNTIHSGVSSVMSDNE